VAAARNAIGDEETNALEKKLELEKLRGSITNNPADLKRFRVAYDAFERARVAREMSQKLWSSHNVNYPGIFESPEKLTLIGRPRDPLFGENPLRKYAIAAAFFSLLLGLALAFLAELFDPRLRSRRQVEALTGLPVVARVNLG
jgi:capsular polysaccharide biosynthesis protein